jgi:hypothetical protein
MRYWKNIFEVKFLFLEVHIKEFVILMALQDVENMKGVSPDNR